MNRFFSVCILMFILAMTHGCATPNTSHSGKPQAKSLSDTAANPSTNVQSVDGFHQVKHGSIWLSHEHIMVDFIGAQDIQLNRENHASVIKEILPYLEELENYGVSYFVDATPNYIGRDVLLLEKLSQQSGLKIITNTGFYGARNSKYVPQEAIELSAEQLAKVWIDEFENGIEGTSIKPGFIKIGVDSSSPLKPLHAKLVKAAALTHQKTGLVIASHTGKAQGLWPQLDILKAQGVPLSAYIWVHAQDEDDNQTYIKAANMGLWISLDGIGWDVEKHIDKLVFAKQHGILHRILISHDAGWYDPQKEAQTIKPYTNIFTQLFPALKAKGFTDQELNLLMINNPARAFSLQANKSQ